MGWCYWAWVSAMPMPVSRHRWHEPPAAIPVVLSSRVVWGPMVPVYGNGGGVDPVRAGRPNAASSPHGLLGSASLAYCSRWPSGIGCRWCSTLRDHAGTVPGNRNRTLLIGTEHLGATGLQDAQRTLRRMPIVVILTHLDQRYRCPHSRHEGSV